MLVNTGGRERTEAQFRELFDLAHLRLVKAAATAGSISVLEAVPASNCPNTLRAAIKSTSITAM